MLPKFLQVFLPSYDISVMDLKDADDKKLIIEAILNKGREKDIKWLFKTYSMREVKNILRNPSRGCWHDRALNYWTKIFDIKINPIIYDMAIFSLTPRPKLAAKYFELMKHKT